MSHKYDWPTICLSSVSERPTRYGITALRSAYSRSGPLVYKIIHQRLSEYKISACRRFLEWPNEGSSIVSECHYPGIFETL
jgi:hypothetical protein